MKHLKIPEPLKKMNDVFRHHGYEAYLVGGAVRDVLRGKQGADWDVATDASPQAVMGMFRKVIPTGIAHGTVTVLFLNHSIEVTTYRTEKDYSDSRHPDSVEYISSIEEDLSRRDFTINAIAASLDDGHIVDPFDGQKDIKEKRIQTVGTPLDRFGEDGLRPIRAIRFAAQLNFTLEEKTLEAIPLSKNKIADISIERFRDEFKKILKSRKPSVALKLMENTGILEMFIPELAQCRGVEQADFRGFHQFDVLDHLFYACDGAPQDNENVRLAALFHDIGKPWAKQIATAENGEKIITFYNHEKYSEEIAQKVLTRLRFPKAQISAVCHLIKNHMFHYESNWTDAAVRRFLLRVTPEALDNLFALRLADVYGMTKTPPLLTKGPWAENLLELKERISKEQTQQSLLGLKDLAVSGKDLISAGIPAGKTMGKILQELLNTVLDDPKQNTKEQLLFIAQNIARQYIDCNVSHTKEKL